ncbi:dTDP-glucose 4,6-dehydratase [Pirellulaceae bacterium SH501]
MRLFVTGAAGFIGSNLCHRLIKNGHNLLAFDKLTYAGNRRSLAALESQSDFRFVQGDICDGEHVSSLLSEFQPEAIMHLAAESHVDRSIDGPEAFIQTNIVGTLRLLQSARKYYETLTANRKARFRFHHISTDEVYGSLGPTDPPFSETTPYDPHSPYSASKASSDHLVRAWFDTYRLPVLITNCSNNYGPYQFPEKLIPVVILKCLRGESIPVYGKGENIRDWLYVDDHCRALEAVVTRGRPGETYNIGGNSEMRNIDLVHLLCKLMDELSPNTVPENALSGHASLIKFVTDRPGHDMRYAINARKIKSELNWEPLETAGTGFRKTIEWYLENTAWWQSIVSGEYQLQRQGLST